ncbi:HdeD family acid-resistance protein [Amaricoccus sp. W119]|uniref:HdeD family acid-resistance protein n=1 Tax=Amaricoccus sp. W119 TaxID=3391833 RepID=UPI0039A523FD
MIQLALLLLGARAVRPLWPLLLLLGLVWIALGIWLLFNLRNRGVVFVEDTLAIFLALEGAVLLLGAGALGLRQGWGAAARGLCFLFAAFLVFNVEWDHNLGAMVVFGAAFVADGAFRIASALVLRDSRLTRGVITGVISILLGFVIFARWPLPRDLTVPFCMALLFIASGLVILRAARQLRRLPEGASVTALPFYTAPNWQARGVVVPALDAGAGPVPGALNVRIWTATGSIDDPERMLVVDRYIATLDKRGVVSTGHAALEAPPDLYVSHYPARELERASDELLTILHSGGQNDVPGKFQPSLAVEAGEWCMPDQTVTFHRFNDQALRAFWSVYSRDTTYNLSARNCSTTVALCLDAATEGLASTGRPIRDFLHLVFNPEFWMLRLIRARAEGMTWTPGLVLDYARLLRRVLEHGRKRWRERLFSALDERRRARSLQSPEGQ